MTKPRSGDDALGDMTKMVSTTLELVSRLDTVVSRLSSDAETSKADDESIFNPAGAAAGSSDTDISIDALAVARDSATLVRAHSTKISLLIINEPFTPTAVAKVLRELVSGPLPALASAAQLCDPKRYTEAFSRELAWRCCRVLKESKELIRRIPTNGSVLSGPDKNASFGAGSEKGSVATTGVLWSACDDVIALANLGVAGYIIRKVEQLRDTLKDILDELKEWSEEESDGEDEEDYAESGYVSADEDGTVPGVRTTQDMLDDIMNSERHIPRDDPERIRPRLESCLRRLRLTVLLYQATIKRRLKKLPSLPQSDQTDETVPRLDEIVRLFKLLPEHFGSSALAFYDLDGVEIDSLANDCFQEAFAASELLLKPWTGDKDEFTDWVLKYQVEVKKI